MVCIAYSVYLSRIYVMVGLVCRHSITLAVNISWVCVDRSTLGNEYGSSLMDAVVSKTRLVILELRNMNVITFGHKAEYYH